MREPHLLCSDDGVVKPRHRGSVEKRVNGQTTEEVFLFDDTTCTGTVTRVESSSWVLAMTHAPSKCPCQHYTATSLS